MVISQKPLLVRGGKDLKSDALPTKLSPGSVIDELNLVGERLLFEKVSGDGPDIGWISTSLTKEEKVVHLAERRAETEGEEKPPLDASEKSPEAPKPLPVEPKKLAPEKEVFWPVGNEGADLSVRITMPADGSKAEVCALFVGGFPMQLYGSWRSEDPLPTAVFEKCWTIGLPTVRFNWTGYGNSKGEPFTDQQDYIFSHDLNGILERVTSDIADKIVVIGYAFGNTYTFPLLATTFRNNVLAYIALSLGFRASALNVPFVEAQGDNFESAIGLPTQDWLKKYQPNAGRILESLTSMPDIPSLWIRGKTDWMTPMKDIEFFVDTMKKTSQPSAKTALTEIKELPGKMAFEGKQDVPAEAIKSFLLKILSL